MTPEQELAEMRRQYRFATLEAHMLVDGEVRLRCLGCRVRPVPPDYFAAALCDQCLDERLAAKRKAVT